MQIEWLLEIPGDGDVTTLNLADFHCQVGSNLSRKKTDNDYEGFLHVQHAAAADLDRGTNSAGRTKELYNQTFPRPISQTPLPLPLPLHCSLT